MKTSFLVIVTVPSRALVLTSLTPTLLLILQGSNYLAAISPKVWAKFNSGQWSRKLSMAATVRNII